MYGAAILFPGHPYIESATALSNSYHCNVQFSNLWQHSSIININAILQLYIGLEFIGLTCFCPNCTPRNEILIQGLTYNFVAILLLCIKYLLTY